MEKDLAMEFEEESRRIKIFSKVALSYKGIFLSQRKYILDLLAETTMLNGTDMPIAQNNRLGEYPDQEPTNKERYQRLVGKLIYLALVSSFTNYFISLCYWFYSPVNITLQQRRKWSFPSGRSFKHKRIIAK